MAIRRQALVLMVAATAVAMAATASARPMSQAQLAQVDRIFGQWGAQSPGCAVGVAEQPIFAAGGLMPRASARAIAEVPLAELAGTCTSVDAGTSYVVSEENGALVARGRYGQVLTLGRVSGDRCFAGPVSVVFRRDARRKIAGLSVSQERVCDKCFERQRERQSVRPGI
jgi:hypothetical protein